MPGLTSNSLYFHDRGELAPFFEVVLGEEEMAYPLHLLRCTLKLENEPN